MTSMDGHLQVALMIFVFLLMVQQKMIGQIN
uniref:Uncharacterized protein n=1 Tax=Siphoviridae sp. ctxMM9 TaxID=2827973 RepID=A0A8S5T634_9CAUD|nr:MAG TPA: hypothetical protein [Siphoviridae sp. ctxMM9]